MTLIIGGCSRSTPAPINQRLAVVTFDNQGNAEDQWISVLMSVAPIFQLRQEQSLAAVHVEDSEGWRGAGAGRVIQGNIRRDTRGFRLEAKLTDTATSRILGQFEAVGAEDELITISARMLETLLGIKASPLTDSPAVWAAFSKAVASRKPASLEEFATSHPEFGPAYPPLARLKLQAGRKDEVAVLVNRYPANGDPLSKAELALVAATDNPSRLAALLQFRKLRGTNPSILLEVANLATSMSEWAIAAEQFSALTKLEPSKPDWWNSLGYAEANQNRLPQAIAALEQYGRLLPNEPNVLDSLGEVNYMNRQFAAAAKYFDEQVRKFPNFQNAAGLRKAAFAYYHAGDSKTADLRFEDWLKRIAPQTLQPFQRAIWLARTGRAKPALEVMEQLRATSSAEAKTSAELHLAMLQFGLEGKRPDTALLKRLSLEAKDANLRNEVSIFALLAQPAASLKDLRARIEAAVPQPQLAPLKNQLIEAAEQIFSTPSTMKPKVFPLPNVADGSIDALLLRSRLAVIP